MSLGIIQMPLLRDDGGRTLVIFYAFLHLPANSTQMKQLIAGWVMATLLVGAAQAQVSSSECLAEVKQVYAQIDHELLLAGATQMRFDFQHSYIMRLDEEGKTVVMQEHKTIGPQYYQHDSPEFTDASDATEAFSFRKNQFLVYRTKPSLAKASIIPDVDKGLLAACTVKECAFVPQNDTLRYKRAFMIVSDEGQKRYKVRDWVMVWNPLTGVLVSLEVNFTDKSMWKWAQFVFSAIGPEATPGGTEIKSILLDEAGELQPRFKGSDVLDYR
jgi:hypothetical protein